MGKRELLRSFNRLIEVMISKEALEPGQVAMIVRVQRKVARAWRTNDRAKLNMSINELIGVLLKNS